MKLFGASIGLLLTLLLMGLAILALYFSPETQTASSLAGRVTGLIITGFLLVYAYAVLSSLVYALLMMFVRARVPVGSRRGANTFLAACYLITTLCYLIFVLPVLLAAYATAAATQKGAMGFLFFALPVLALVNFVVVAIAYINAALAAPAIIPGPGAPLVSTPGELAWRGFMIGMNTGVNMMLGALLLEVILYPLIGFRAHTMALVIGLMLGLVNILASIVQTQPANVRPIIQGVLGWYNWLMPASWNVICVGWVLFCFNLLFHLLISTLPVPFAPFFRIVRVEIHWPTGTIFTEGGVSSNFRFKANPFTGALGSAYDLGGFGYVHAGLNTAALPTITLLPGSAMATGLLLHESGHNLSLAAFGSSFHWIGAIDENVLRGATGTAAAYAERLAQSHVLSGPPPFGTDPVVPMWI